MLKKKFPIFFCIVDALVQLGGYMTLDDYPYTARDGSCKFNSSKIAVPVTGFEWAIPTCEYSNCDKQDIDQFLTNVGDRGVASSICVYVNNFSTAHLW